MIIITIINVTLSSPTFHLWTMHDGRYDPCMVQSEICCDVVWYSKVVDWSVWYVVHTMYNVHLVIKSTVWFSKIPCIERRCVLIMVCCMVWLGMVWHDLLRDTHSFVRFMSHSLSTDRQLSAGFLTISRLSTDHRSQLCCLRIYQFKEYQIP